MEVLTKNPLNTLITKWYNVEPEAYRHFYEQAKERFEDILQESESITNKAFKMAGALATFAGFLIGLLSQDYFVEGKSLLVLLATVIIVANSVLLYLLIAPKNVKFRGSPPILSIAQDFDSKEDKNHQMQLAYYTSLSLLQADIDHMRAMNASRISLYRWSLNLSFLLVLFVSAIGTIILFHP